MLRALVIDETAMVEVTRVLGFANKRENYFVPGNTPFVPGDRDEYVAMLGTYRCVFTVTLMNDRMYRHLSISIPEKLPNPIAAFTIARMFGFTGGSVDDEVVTEPSEEWQIGLDEKRVVVVLAQEIAN
jgi:hypothetical protein